METSEQPSLMSSSELTELSAASPASPLASPGVTEAKTTSATCGPRLSEPFAHYNQDSHSWRTFQISLITSTLAEYSETWPKRGTMRNGVLSERQTLAHPTAGNGYLSWPTPSTMDTVSAGLKSTQVKPGSMHSVTLPRMAEMMWPTPRAAESHRKLINGEHRSQTTGLRYGIGLMQMAEQMWATPQAADSAQGAIQNQDVFQTPSGRLRKRANTGITGSIGLARETVLWPTPNTAASNSPPTQTTSTDGHICCPKCRRQLNPVFVEMLMAFPIGWTIAPKD